MYGHIKYATTGGPFPDAGQEFRFELFINDHFVGECTKRANGHRELLWIEALGVLLHMAYQSPDGIR